MMLPAAAQSGGAFLTAARLLALCKTDNPYCTEYIAGVADTLAPLSVPGGPLPPNSLAGWGQSLWNSGRPGCNTLADHG